MADERDEILLTLTADIVSAHVANNSVAVGDLANLIGNVHEALAKLGEATIESEPVLKPAISSGRSIKPEYIVCLEDGKKLKLLKRHLRTDHNLSPPEYRAKWGLPKSYPMVAPAYAEARRQLAITIGLGRKKSGSALTSKTSGKLRSSKPAAAPKKSRPRPKTTTVA